MLVRSLRGKRRRAKDLGKDRAVVAVVFLAVTIVLLLIGFTGPSIEFRLPGLTGWVYIGVVIAAAIVVLVRLFSVRWRRQAGRPAPE